MPSQPWCRSTARGWNATCASPQPEAGFAPGGFDAYLLVNVLHDWSDEDATRILGNVAAALGAAGRVFVIDSNCRVVPREELSIRADVLMAALTSGGQERSAAAFSALGAKVGLRLVRTSPLASGDLAHEFRPASAHVGAL